MSSPKFTVTYGIHRGTFTSRDSAHPQYFDTENEAREYGESIAKDFKYTGGRDSLGCYLWFLTMRKPDGTTVQLRPGNTNY